MSYENYGMLIDYKYCSGCHSCEVACKELNGFGEDEHGIKVLEKGPFKLGGSGHKGEDWDWDYIPVPTDRCDLCADRMDRGEKPLCVKSCLAACMKIGPIEELAKDMLTMGKKVMIYKHL